MAITKSYQAVDEVTLDLFSSYAPSPVVECPQFEDRGRAIKATLTSKGEKYSVPAGHVPHVYMLKFDGKVVDNLCEYEDDKVMIELTKQMTFVEGDNIIKVAIVNSVTSAVVQSATILLKVLCGPNVADPEKSSDEYKAMDQILAEVEKWGQLVEDNEQNIQDVIDNMSAIEAAPSNAQAAQNSADEAKRYADLAQQVSQGAVGFYENEASLKQAHPTAQDGNWAIIGETDTIWVWDSDTNKWRDTLERIDLSGYYSKTESDERYASKEQGAKADSALQPAGDSSNTTITFAAASTRANIATGEKLSVIMGKLAKWFADLKAVAWSGSYNDLSNKPTALKNPQALTISLNGESQGAYDGSSAKSVNVTPDSIGAIPKDNAKTLASGITWGSGSTLTPDEWDDYAIIQLSSNYGRAIIRRLPKNGSTFALFASNTADYINITCVTITRNSTGGSLALSILTSLRLSTSGITKNVTEFNIYQIDGLV